MEGGNGDTKKDVMLERAEDPATDSYLETGGREPTLLKTKALYRNKLQGGPMQNQQFNL